MNGVKSVRIGSLIRYNHRYAGQIFVVIDVHEGSPTNGWTPKVRSVSVQTGIKTRWSSANTISVLA